MSFKLQELVQLLKTKLYEEHETVTVLNVAVIEPLCHVNSKLYLQSAQCFTKVV